MDGCLRHALQWCSVVRVVGRPVISLRWYVPPGVGPIDRSVKVLLWHICSKLVGAHHLGSSRLLLIPLCIRHRHRLLMPSLRRRYLLETVKGWWRSLPWESAHGMWSCKRRPTRLLWCRRNQRWHLQAAQLCLCSLELMDPNGNIWGPPFVLGFHRLTA